MKNFESLTVNELQNIYGGTNWKKIGKYYAGTLGSAVLGFGAMGPVGYWAGAGVGYASFC